MSDLINRTDAIRVVREYMMDNQISDGDYHADGIERELHDLPSAEPERKTGEWVQTFNGNEWYWFCSNCKEEWYEEDLWMGGNSFPNFCPNCGAKMEVEE